MTFSHVTAAKHLIMFARMKQILALAFLALTLAACGDATVIKPATYQQLSGWQGDSHAEAFAVFMESCAANETRERAYQSRKEGPIGVRENWRRACTIGANLGQPTDAQARQFFETYFAPYKVETESQPKGLITGYYEPILKGSKTKKAPYLTPVYGVPSDIKTRKPYFSRAEIEAGALKTRAPVLLYVSDPVGLFFLHIQGSGKIRLSDGSMVGIQYAAQNGYEYVPIGRIMKERGLISDVSLQTIRDWLNAHPDQMHDIMNENPSYVFFKMGPGDKPAKGALGLPLTALRSIAVDDDRAAYGVPTFIDGSKMSYATRRSTPMQRLFVSQDTGGALHSPHRADVFFGQGDAAEWEAGHQNVRANVYWLLPLAEAPHVEVPPVLTAPADASAAPEGALAPAAPLSEPDPFAVMPAEPVGEQEMTPPPAAPVDAAPQAPEAGAQ